MSMIAVNDGSFQNEVKNYQGYVLIDFWAEWCMPCKRLMPIVEAVSTQHKNVKFVKVNVDDNPNLASEYNIRSIPTLIILKDGKIVDTKNGGAPAVELNDWIKKHAI